MSTDTVSLFLRHLALSEETSRLGTASDIELLEAYEAGRGQAAFSELMRRHGPMVLRTCRRVLGHHPDAEDAFQATFVLLARKAARLQAESDGSLSLAGWLHRVAYRTSLNVLTGATRRKSRERQAPAMTRPQPDPVNEATWNEVRPILDAELDALPEPARRLLVACYLQGKTHAEAAAELGLPAGSVAWRLNKARALLAARLARRGIAVSAAVLVALMGGLADGAGVPAVLLVHSIEAAVTFKEQAAGAVSDRVAGLVQSGLAKMPGGATRWGVVLAGWVGVLTAGLIALQTLKAQPEVEPDDPQLVEHTRLPGEEPLPQDRLGDSLPRGALARLGTIRLRVSFEGESGLAFTRDGGGIVTAGGSSPTRLWEVGTGKLIRQFSDGHRLHVQAVAPSPDGRFLAARGGKDGGLYLWDIATGKLFAEGKGGSASGISLAISPDSRLVASAGSDRKIRLWDSGSGAEYWVQSSGKYNVTALGFGPDGKSLMAVDAKGITLWDTATGAKATRKWASKRVLSYATIVPDGKTAAVVSSDRATGSHDHNVSLVNLVTLTEIRQLAPETDERGILSIALDPAARVLATTNGNGETRLWDTATGKELRRCLGEASYADALTFSADGSRLAALDRGVVRVWETSSGKEIATARIGHKQVVSAVEFSPDGKSLISIGWDGLTCVWDPATGEERRHFAPPESEFEGRFLAGMAMVAGPNGTLTTASLALKKLETFGVGVCRWDGNGAREVGHLFQDLGVNIPQTIILSPDGKTVAYVPRNEERAEVWLQDAVTGGMLRKIAGGYPAFSHDGKLLLTCSGGANAPGSFAVWGGGHGATDLFHAVIQRTPISGVFLSRRQDGGHGEFRD